MLSHKKVGYIAKAIGPQDVLATLLNNLRVSERQSRVCTAVAIGIVAETVSFPVPSSKFMLTLKYSVHHLLSSRH